MGHDFRNIDFGSLRQTAQPDVLLPESAFWYDYLKGSADSVSFHTRPFLEHIRAGVGLGLNIGPARTRLP